MILAEHTFSNRSTCQASTRTLYVVKCDKCGRSHDEPAIMPDTSALYAQMSGWDVATPFPGEDFQSLRVVCPKCKR